MVILNKLVVVVVVDCPRDIRFFRLLFGGTQRTVFCKISCSEKHILPRIFYHY